MDLESEYLKAKTITNSFELYLRKKHDPSNLLGLFFELRKRTTNVKLVINSVDNNINGYFDSLILGHIINRSCNWYMYIHDYFNIVNQNEKIKNNINITMMYKDDFIFDEWFTTLSEALEYVQTFYSLKKDDFEFSSLFQSYFLKINDIITKKENYAF